MPYSDRPEKKKIGFVAKKLHTDFTDNIIFELDFSEVD